VIESNDLTGWMALGPNSIAVHAAVSFAKRSSAAFLG